MNVKKFLFGKDISELLWAEYYKLSIADKSWLKSLAIYPGRWAGNFTFFYVLNRVLDLKKPENILEFGLGQSTRFINAYLVNQLKRSALDVIEHDHKWIDFFRKDNSLCERIVIHKTELSTKNFKGISVPSYKFGDDFFTDKHFDLVIIDAPFGSKNKFSRIDILELQKKFPKCFEKTIFIFDDTHRKGELNTFKELVSMRPGYSSTNYHGNKSVGIAVPNELKFLLSL